MRPARILVVDDTVEVRTLVSRILEGQGYQVIDVSNAQQALSASEEAKGEIDLLVTDIKMPGMDGIELAVQLTTSYPEIQVLFISGQCEESEIQVHIEKGFGFLSKPFMPHVLLNYVQEALAKSKRPPESAESSSGGEPQKENERTG
jgi:two-component system, cell cycle sensor histidine kinase and response regulator CckA